MCCSMPITDRWDDGAVYPSTAYYLYKLILGNKPNHEVHAFPEVFPIPISDPRDWNIHLNLVDFYDKFNSQLKRMWLLLDDDQPLLTKRRFVNQPIKNGGQGLPGYTSVPWIPWV